MRLKNAADPADGVAMFAPSKQPPALSEACLQSLCASLNAPVVHLDALPAGPARCAVVVYAEQYGDLGLAVAVRSLEGGEVVVMRAREPLPPETPPRDALEKAISFAESLGFLFDDDMLGAESSRQTRLAALDHWLKLIGPDEVFAARDVASPPPPAGGANSPELDRMPEMEDLLSAAAVPGDDEPIELEELSIGDLEVGDLEAHGDELLLDDIAPLDEGEIDELDAGFTLAEPAGSRRGKPLQAAPAADGPRKRAPRGRTRTRATAPPAAGTEPVGPGEARISSRGPAEGRAAFAAKPLSKFRRPDDGPADGAEADAADGDEPGGGSALGRVKIVRMKKARDGSASARGRVLASY